MNNTKRGFFLCEVLHSISASDVRRGVFVYIPSLVRDNQLRKAPTNKLTKTTRRTKAPIYHLRVFLVVYPV